MSEFCLEAYHISKFYFLQLKRAKLEREELARVSAFKARLDALDQSAKKYELKVGNKLEVTIFNYIYVPI